MDIKRLLRWGKFSSFIIDSWFINSSLVSKKVSVYRNEQNGQEHIKSHKDKLCQLRSVHGVSVMWIIREYLHLTIVTVNNLGCGRSLFAKENLYIINNCFHQPAY